MSTTGTITGASGLVYDPLPIDNAAGFPQSFPFLQNGVRYQFTVYADIPEAALGSIDEVMALPDPQRFLVVRADVVQSDGTTSTVFLRKVVPSLEYRAGALMLTFPTQMVARRNLNAAGNFGSNVIGGVAGS
jgi:hypothetical protein